jgi:hypothetical protein
VFQVHPECLETLLTSSPFLAPAMRKEYPASYSPVSDHDDTKLLDSNAETIPPPKSRLLRWSPWLSHGVLMSITMVFFVLWVRAPSIDDVVLYCRWTDSVNAQDLAYSSQLQQTRGLNPSAL